MPRGSGRYRPTRRRWPRRSWRRSQPGRCGAPGRSARLQRPSATRRRGSPARALQGQCPARTERTPAPAGPWSRTGERPPALRRTGRWRATPAPPWPHRDAPKEGAPRHPGPRRRAAPADRTARATSPMPTLAERQVTAADLASRQDDGRQRSAAPAFRKECLSAWARLFLGLALLGLGLALLGLGLGFLARLFAVLDLLDDGGDPLVILGEELGEGVRRLIG